MTPGRYSISQLCVDLGVDRRTLSKRLELAGIEPVEVKGRTKLYRMKDAVDVSNGEADKSKPGESESAARARLTRARADIHEATAAEIAGDLVPTGAIEKAWSSILASIRGHIIALPDRAAPGVADADGINEIREILRDIVAEVLGEIAETPIVFEEKKPANASTGTDRDPGLSRPTARRPRRPQATAPPAAP